jgi:hypothetical protein
MCLLCPLHPEAPLPSHDVRRNPLLAAGKKTAPVNEFSLFWEQLAIPEDTPDPADPFDNHFKLQVGTNFPPNCVAAIAVAISLQKCLGMG